MVGIHTPTDDSTDQQLPDGPVVFHSGTFSPRGSDSPALWSSPRRQPMRFVSWRHFVQSLANYASATALLDKFAELKASIVASLNPLCFSTAGQAASVSGPGENIVLTEVWTVDQISGQPVKAWSHEEGLPFPDSQTLEDSLNDVSGPPDAGNWKVTASGDIEVKSSISYHGVTLANTATGDTATIQLLPVAGSDTGDPSLRAAFASSIQSSALAFVRQHLAAIGQLGGGAGVIGNNQREASARAAAGSELVEIPAWAKTVHVMAVGAPGSTYRGGSGAYGNAWFSIGADAADIAQPGQNLLLVAGEQPEAVHTKPAGFSGVFVDALLEAKALLIVPGGGNGGNNFDGGTSNWPVYGTGGGVGDVNPDLRLQGTTGTISGGNQYGTQIYGAGGAGWEAGEWNAGGSFFVSTKALADPTEIVGNSGTGGGLVPAAATSDPLYQVGAGSRGNDGMVAIEFYAYDPFAT